MNRTSDKAALLPHGRRQRAVQPPEGGRGARTFTPVVVRDACHAPQVCSIQTAYAPPTPSARAGPSSGNGLRSRTPGRLFTGFAHGCAARHCAPRRRCAPRADEGQNPCPLRPPDANGMSDIDRRKATKGRRMARELAVGAKAPAFSLPRDGGDKVALKDFKGSKLVLYFYPKADTPGCTKEAIAFSKLRAAFAKAGTEILGVSADPVTAQDKFKTK